jgi:hypothetical protein
MNWRSALIAITLGMLLLQASCNIGISSSENKVLDNAPRPGIVGEANEASATDYVEDRLTFKSHASEEEIRSEFETYAKKLGLTKSTDPPTLKERTLYESGKQDLSISIRELDANTRSVTYYHRY